MIEDQNCNLRTLYDLGLLLLPWAPERHCVTLDCGVYVCVRVTPLCVAVLQFGASCKTRPAPFLPNLAILFCRNGAINLIRLYMMGLFHTIN